jgi:REP element-mobilizing transposase RayT
MSVTLRDTVDLPTLIVNGVQDHVHALFLVSRKVPLMRIVGETKTETSKWVKKQRTGPKDFAWPRGYGAFSVSESNIQEVRRYIDNGKNTTRQ